MRRVFSLTSALVVCGLLASGAWAKDICVIDNWGDYYKFVGVKSLSQPGKISPLQGTADVGGANAPVSGTAVRTSSGVHIGFFTHLMAPFSSSGNFSATLVTDTNFTGTGYLDHTGDMDEDLVLNFTAVSCAILPPL